MTSFLNCISPVSDMANCCFIKLHSIRSFLIKNIEKYFHGFIQKLQVIIKSMHSSIDTHKFSLPMEIITFAQIGYLVI